VDELRLGGRLREMREPHRHVDRNLWDYCSSY
jgi:hypothetical protein